MGNHRHASEVPFKFNINITRTLYKNQVCRFAFLLLLKRIHDNDTETMKHIFGIVGMESYDLCRHGSREFCQRGPTFFDNFSFFPFFIVDEEWEIQNTAKSGQLNAGLVESCSAILTMLAFCIYINMLKRHFLMQLL